MAASCLPGRVHVPGPDGACIFCGAAGVPPLDWGHKGGYVWKNAAEVVWECADDCSQASHDEPTTDERCAGRSAVAHEPTTMVDGACPVCGERELVHRPFTDDGVTYCGWDGHEGCGELWPCATERAHSGRSPE